MQDMLRILVPLDFCQESEVCCKFSSVSIPVVGEEDVSFSSSHLVDIPSVEFVGVSGWVSVRAGPYCIQIELFVESDVDSEHVWDGEEGGGPGSEDDLILGFLFLLRFSKARRNFNCLDCFCQNVDALISSLILLFSSFFLLFGRDLLLRWADDPVPNPDVVVSLDWTAAPAAQLPISCLVPVIDDLLRETWSTHAACWVVLVAETAEDEVSFGVAVLNVLFSCLASDTVVDPSSEVFLASVPICHCAIRWESDERFGVGHGSLSLFTVAPPAPSFACWDLVLACKMTGCCTKSVCRRLTSRDSAGLVSEGGVLGASGVFTEGSCPKLGSRMGASGVTRGFSTPSSEEYKLGSACVGSLAYGFG